MNTNRQNRRLNTSGSFILAFCRDNKWPRKVLWLSSVCYEYSPQFLVVSVASQAESAEIFHFLGPQKTEKSVTRIVAVPSSIGVVFVKGSVTIYSGSTNKVSKSGPCNIRKGTF